MIFLAGTVAHSQTTKDSIKRKGFSIEPYLGLGTSEAVQNGTNNLGWKGGCMLVYMFNEHCGISSGLQVQRYSTNINSGNDSVYVSNSSQSFTAINSMNATYNFTYLEIPLLLRYISSTESKPGIFAEVGFVAGFLISSTESLNLYASNNVNTFYNPYSPPEANPNSNISNFQGHLAIGILIPITARCSILADVSMNNGFTDVGNSNNDFVNINYTGSRYDQSPFYYYDKNYAHTTPTISNYGTNFSGMVSVRLNIKLGK